MWTHNKTTCGITVYLGLVHYGESLKILDIYFGVFPKLYGFSDVIIDRE